MYMIGEPVKLAEVVKLPQEIEEVQADEGDYIGDDGLLHCGKCKGKSRPDFRHQILQVERK